MKLMYYDPEYILTAFNDTYDLFEVIYDLKQPKNSTNLEQKLIEISSPERWPILFLLLHLRQP